MKSPSRSTKTRPSLPRMSRTSLSYPPSRRSRPDALGVSADQATATQAQAGLATLQAQDQATLQLDEPAVSEAEQTLAADTALLTTTQGTAGQDQIGLDTAEEQFAAAGCPKPPSGSTADCTALASAVTQAQSAVTSDEGTLISDQSVVAIDQQSVQDDQSTLLIAGLNDQSSLSQAEAKYTTAEQALSVADASLANAQAAVSQSQRDVDVVTQVDAQRVTAVEAQIQSQKDSLKDDRLTAPISGKVKSIQIKPGTVVNSAPSELTSATKTPSAAIVIDSGGSLVAETNVDGGSASNVRVGDAVQLAIPQHPSIDGKVSSIGIISTDPTGTESAPVTIIINGEPSGIYPGLSAEAAITLVQKRHVLSVPSDAVHTSGTRHLRRRTRQRSERRARRGCRSCRNGTHANQVGAVRRNQSCGSQVIGRPMCREAELEIPLGPVGRNHRRRTLFVTKQGRWMLQEGHTPTSRDKPWIRP